MPTCPVCGFPELEEPPRSASGGGSYEICPSCGFQFGVDDDDKGITPEEWRGRWKDKGFAWSSRGIPMPRGWDAKAQLATVSGKPVVKKPQTPPPAPTKPKAGPAKPKVAAKAKKPAPKSKTPVKKPPQVAKRGARKKR